MMVFGEFEIHTFVEQQFHLDGGSMFGVVPKSIWARQIPADGNNLIPMVTNLFVLKAHGKRIIFDIGLGDTLTDREKKIYGTDGVSNLEPGLAGLGLSVDDIDYVVLTHLHTDHAGGAVKQVDGQYVPRFPNARYVIAEQEWEAALNPDERTAAVYVPEHLTPLKQAGQVQFIKIDGELLPGVRAVFTGGHTRGHFALEIESEDTSVFYYADIFCSTAHLGVAWVPATDLFPLDTMKVKRRTLPRI
ncbi:MAG: MBL fold metallo-hydrolase, partial [candidate division Zixibacteria bacterium]|nr:MBL fold metallo-hydrolase [candidate division Zixibacteria bacterium]